MKTIIWKGIPDGKDFREGTITTQGIKIKSGVETEVPDDLNIKHAEEVKDGKSRKAGPRKDRDSRIHDDD